MTQLRRVLIIEDNPMDAKILTQALDPNLYFWTTESDAFRGLSSLHTEHFDLILLDWNLPKLSGVDFLKHLKSEPRFAEIPVVIISGRNEARHIKEAVSKGAVDYVIKPIDIPIVKEKILKIFDNSNSDWTFYHLPSPSPAEIVTACEVVSFNELGCQVRSSKKFQLGEVLSLRVSFIPGSESKLCLARILSLSEAPDKKTFLYNLAFIGLKESDQQALRLFAREVFLQNKNKVTQL